MNVVMGTDDGTKDKVQITIDDRPLKPTEAGSDILFDESGNSYVIVEKSDMYRIVNLPKFANHEVKILCNGATLHVFAFTFGSYVRDSNREQK